jgi:hypothetical protein
VVRLLVVVLVCAMSALYLLGAGVLGYLFAPAACGWLREHPAALRGSARRGLAVTALVAGWPVVAAALGWLRWSKQHRCPIAECALFGWRTPGTAQARALITAYWCPHRYTPPAVRSPGLSDDQAWCEWCSVVPASLLASTLGALASIPIPGPGFLAVYATVTAITVFPLDVLAEDVLRRYAAKVARLESARVDE